MYKPRLFSIMALGAKKKPLCRLGMHRGLGSWVEKQSLGLYRLGCSAVFAAGGNVDGLAGNGILLLEAGILTAEGFQQLMHAGWLVLNENCT